MLLSQPTNQLKEYIGFYNEVENRIPRTFSPPQQPNHRNQTTACGLIFISAVLMRRNDTVSKWSVCVSGVQFDNFKFQIDSNPTVPKQITSTLRSVWALSFPLPIPPSFSLSLARSLARLLAFASVSYDYESLIQKMLTSWACPSSLELIWCCPCSSTFHQHTWFDATKYSINMKHKSTYSLRANQFWRFCSVFFCGATKMRVTHLIRWNFKEDQFKSKTENLIPMDGNNRD